MKKYRIWPRWIYLGIRYRILEVKNHTTGDHLFYPQYRSMFFSWKCPEYDEGCMKFATLKEAKKWWPPRKSSFTQISHY